MGPAQAASLLIVPSLVTNVWQLAAGPRFGTLAHRLWPMMAGVVVGTSAGAGLMARDASGWGTIGLGLALVLYAGLSLAAVRLTVPTRAEGWFSPLVGTATGLVTAATGVFVIPAVPYLQALGLAKNDLRGRVSEKAFRLCFFLGLLILGGHLGSQAFFF